MLNSGGCPLLIKQLTSCASLPADRDYDRLKCVSCGCLLNTVNNNGTSRKTIYDGPRQVSDSWLAAVSSLLALTNREGVTCPAPISLCPQPTHHPYFCMSDPPPPSSREAM